MADQPPKEGELILYRAANDAVRVEVLYEGETFWLNQRQMAELFGVDVRTINEHLRNVFEANELAEAATIRKIRIVQTEGSREVARDVSFYNLDAIISVGYRVNSAQATQFRIWATQTLREFIVKGFVLDDERLKLNKRFGKDYFDELLERIREIRASERRFYLKITDIYEQCSIDYDAHAETTKTFFKTVQNKLHWAVTGRTAAEIIADRADASKPSMGLTTWRSAPTGKILKSDVTIAKNYLIGDEIKELERIVSMYLDYAENQAARQIPMKMADWVQKLDAFLTFNEYEVLTNAGKVSKAIADRLPYIEYYPDPATVRAVQIDRDAARIGLRYPVAAGLAGDARETLRLLLPLLERKTDRGFIEQARQWKTEWYAALEEGADRLGTPMKPQRVVRDLNLRLADDALIATDCGQNTGLAAQYLRIKAEQGFAVSGTLASMGGGVPYAIAAALAFPGRQVIAVVGDGGLSMSVAELETCVRYTLPVKVIVINNSALAQIKWEQMLFLGHPEFGCTLGPVNFAAVAEGFGVRGFRVEDPAACGTTLDAALAHDGPALVDAVVDASEPMLPPKRREEYVRKLTAALEKGTPERHAIERALAEEPALTSLKR